MALTLESLYQTGGAGMSGVETLDSLNAEIGAPISGDVTTTNSSNDFWSGINSGLNGLASLFDNGVKVANSVGLAVQATNSIDASRPATTVVQVQPSNNGAVVFDKKTLITMGVVLAAGLGLLFVAHKMKW